MSAIPRKKRFSQSSSNSELSSPSTSVLLSTEGNQQQQQETKQFTIPKKKHKKHTTLTSSTNTSTSTPTIHVQPSKQKNLEMPVAASTAVASSSWDKRGEYQKPFHNSTVNIISQSPFIIGIQNKYIPKDIFHIIPQQKRRPPRQRIRQSLSTVSSSQEVSTKRTTTTTTPTQFSRLRRSSGRNSTRKRKLYVEKDESDSDFLEDSSQEDEMEEEKGWNDKQNNDGVYREEEEEEYEQIPKKRSAMKKRLHKMSTTASRNSNSSSRASPSMKAGKDVSIMEIDISSSSNLHSHPQQNSMIINTEDIMAPPNGTLPSLWYSQEIYTHVWVIEKIIGWKVRRKVSISYNNGSDNNNKNDHKNDNHHIPNISHSAIEQGDDQNKAESSSSAAAEIMNTTTNSTEQLNESMSKELSDKLINYYISKSSTKRMELSRICPIRCPMVLKAYVGQQGRKMLPLTTQKEEELAKEGQLLQPRVQEKTLKSDDARNDVQQTQVQQQQQQPQPNTAIEKDQPCVKLNLSSEDDVEEVLLIKWRGKSHLHCSWERPRDLELYDTTNNTAKGKIKRYYQSQHMAYGKDWRKVLRRRGRGGDTEGSDNGGNDGGSNKNIIHLNDMMDSEEYFPPEYMEVERIMACDETEMNMSVFSLQRELNLQAENENETTRLSSSAAAVAVVGGDLGSHSIPKQELEEEAENLSFLDEEKPWDPEDNVRYVVKWKSLQLTEITWEYWIHIKHQCVDEAEDFWYRQKPSVDVLNAKREQSHPSMRDYKKLSSSPIFGISSMKRPVGKLDQSKDNDDNDAITNNTDISQSSEGLKLRSYQLEGVNWLIWNWWNKRSCILADEMVSFP